MLERVKSNLYCNITKFTLNNTRIWCNTEIIGRMTLPDVHKICDNIDTEKPMYWEIELLPMKPFLWELIGQKKIRASR